jgi:hypothetical protein
MRYVVAASYSLFPSEMRLWRTEDEISLYQNLYWYRVSGRTMPLEARGQFGD